MKLYSELADWWPLLSAPADYAVEAAHYWKLLTQHARRPISTMLELGSGGGNNASHLKQHCRMTLCDLSPQMLAVSGRLNPECEHVQGDMRSVRLRDVPGRANITPSSAPLRLFDAVFVHDAVMHMTDEPSLRSVVETAFAHCAPGGATIFVPDCVRETFRPSTGHDGHDANDLVRPTALHGNVGRAGVHHADDAGGRALRYLDWTWDPDPSDSHYTVQMTFALRDDAGRVTIEHEQHRFGLFSIDTWLRMLREAGFEAVAEEKHESTEWPGRCFLGRRS